MPKIPKPAAPGADKGGLSPVKTTHPPKAAPKGLPKGPAKGGHGFAPVPKPLRLPGKGRGG